MTIYLFVATEEQRPSIKQLHRFAVEYLRSWFPKLGSYAAFNNRINNLSEAFKGLLTALFTEYFPENCFPNQSLLDSMPIITCSGKRLGKVAKDLTDKGYCPTKSMYYFGVKLHALAFRREKSIPFPEEILIAPASTNDLAVFKEAWADKENRCFFGDKIYHHQEFFSELEKENNTIMMTPVKALKGECQEIRNRNKAADGLFSAAVSRVRQPIEPFLIGLLRKPIFKKQVR